MSDRRHAVSDVLEELSNEEIRKRILIYGGPNLPVTEQTRGRLLEVLREYIEKSEKNSRPKESKSVDSNAHISGSRSNDFNLDRSGASSMMDDMQDEIFYDDDIEEENFPLQVMLFSILTFAFSLFVYKVANKLMYDELKFT